MIAALPGAHLERGDSVTSDSIEEQIERVVRADVVRRDTGLEEALRRCAGAGEAVFLFGGDDATIQALRSRIRAAWPGLRLTGVHGADTPGPTGAAILARIATCAPDLVIADVAPKRHRALIAEFASHGLHTGLINLPGTFARYVATHPGAPGAAEVPARFKARLPLALGKALGDFAGISRFSGLVARPFVHGAAAPSARQAYPAVRHDG